MFEGLNYIFFLLINTFFLLLEKTSSYLPFIFSLPKFSDKALSLFSLPSPSPSLMVGHRRPWTLSITNVPPTSPVTINHRQNPQILKSPTHLTSPPINGRPPPRAGDYQPPTCIGFFFPLSLSLPLLLSHCLVSWSPMAIRQWGRREEERVRKRERFVW